jgi:hypothetical protein
MPFTTPQIINIGTYPNDGSGDDLRTAFTKVNENFTLINSELGVTNAANIGSAGEGIFASKTDNELRFKKITGSGGVTVTSTSSTVNIEALSSIQGDLNPTLGADLVLNGHNITGTGNVAINGDVRSTVWGLDVRTINAQVQAMTGSDVDFGGFLTGIGTLEIDFGTF